CVLVGDGATLLLGGTARPNPSPISLAPALLLARSPWSHSMSTPAIAVAADGWALPRAIFQDQWKRYARFASRLVEVTDTLAPASSRALMNALTLALNGSTRSSTLELFFAWVLAHVTQDFPLFVFGMGVTPGRCRGRKGNEARNLILAHLIGRSSGSRGDVCPAFWLHDIEACENILMRRRSAPD